MGKASRRRRDQIAPAGDPHARMASTGQQAPAPAAPAPAKPQVDTRLAQMERAAHYLEHHPDSTAKEIDAACDTGGTFKVLSEMRVHGYGIRKGWRNVPCDHGTRTRQVRTYRLLYRPRTQPDLFKAE